MMKQTVLRGMREFQCRELPESGRVREREQVSGAALRRTLHTHIPCCRDRSPLDFSSAEMEEETAEHVRFPRSGLEQWRGEPADAACSGGCMPGGLDAESPVPDRTARVAEAYS
ncbi:hypothetical protein [uncultured Victivallis sp.]|uniref:hypothetical protein n=1 Tax=uncultured Victivallis sp. TaxID=354118 RepID=UPI00258C2236|nr:hypothetical protein [uncultured Victivallis sp.]